MPNVNLWPPQVHETNTQDSKDKEKLKEPDRSILHPSVRSLTSPDSS